MYERKVLMGFIRVHILHHAIVDNGIFGLEMIKELESHNYIISPGTLYPILHDMEKNNLLKVTKKNVDGKIRKIYNATKEGKKTFENLKKFILELSKEVIE